MSGLPLFVMSFLLVSGVAVGIGGSVVGGLVTMDRPWHAMGAIVVGIILGCIWALLLSMLALAGLVGAAFL